MPTYLLLASRAFVDDFRKMGRVEWRHGKGNEGGARVGDGKGATKKKHTHKKKKQQVHLSSLDFPGVPCVSSLEQRPGNLIPFSIYLNPFTQTPLPTSSTLFLPLSFRLFSLFFCVPSVLVHPSLIRSSTVAQLPTIRIRWAKGGTRFRHFLPLCYECCSVSLLGRVSNKAAEKGRLTLNRWECHLVFNCLLYYRNALRDSHFS